MKKPLWTVVLVLIVVIGVALYLGVLTPFSTPTQPVPVTVTHPEAVDILPNVASVLYTDSTYGFDMYRPATADSKTTGFDGYLPLTQTPVVAFTLPRDLFAKTNLGEAGVYIGATTTPAIVRVCTSAVKDQGETATSTTKVIDGVTFTSFTSADAGAGNIYERTALRTVHNGTCFEIVELLHSAQIANYPAGTVTAFDRAQFAGYLDAMVSTFKFATSTPTTAQ